jgi:tetratricopeptide (TPR) repeat protein
MENINEVERIEIEGLLPPELKDYQRMVGVHFSHDAFRIVKENGRTYYRLDVEAESLSPYKTVQVSYDLMLYSYDLDKAGILDNEYQNRDTSNLQMYLNPDFYIKHRHKRFLQAIEKISGDTDLTVVENIYEYVRNRLSYNAEIASEQVDPVYSWKRKEGVCSDYATLMVTICRLKGIPARVVVGSMAVSRENTSHKWCEVFLNDYGWVPVEVTFGTDKVDMASRRNRYIHLAYETDEYITNTGKLNYLDRYGKSVMPVYMYMEVNHDLYKDRNRIISSYETGEAAETLHLLNNYLEKDPKSVTMSCLKAMTLARQGQMDEANKLLQHSLSIAEHRYQKMQVYYTYANYLSLAGMYGPAMSYLQQAIDYGFDNIEHIFKDRDLTKLRETDAFRAWKASLNL